MRATSDWHGCVTNRWLCTMLATTSVVGRYVWRGLIDGEGRHRACRARSPAMAVLCVGSAGWHARGRVPPAATDHGAAAMAVECPVVTLAARW